MRPGGSMRGPGKYCSVDGGCSLSVQKGGGGGPRIESQKEDSKRSASGWIDAA